MLFDEFYQTYYWKVYAYFTHKGIRHHDAEELTQEVFLYCHQHYDAYDPKKSAISTWLYMITASRFKNYCRDRKLTVPYDDLVEINTGDDPVALAAEVDEKRRLLAEALKQLPEVQREAVVLRYFQGYSSAETAKRLGVSDGNARVILSRALSAVREACGWEKDEV